MMYSSYGANNSPTINGFAMFNSESIVDKTMLAFSMWKTTIKLGIYPVIESENDEIRYDKKSGIAIYLTPIKAWNFAQLIRAFKRDPEKYHGKGIPSGQQLITIEDPAKGFNKPGAGPCIVIRKINPETGSMESSYAYETRKEQGTVIDSYNEKNATFTQSIEFPQIELDLIIMQLENYTKAMTNTYAFTVVDAVSQPLEKIASKLGVNLDSGYTNNNYKNNSYFNSNTPPTSKPNNGYDDDLPF